MQSFMRRVRWQVAMIATLMVAGVVSAGVAGEPARTGPPPAAQEAVREPVQEAAARTCTKCHDEDEAFPVLSILKTRHAVSADARTPFAGLGDQGCINCHGPSEAHTRRAEGGGKRASPDVAFSKASLTPVSEQNAVCLDCHQSSARLHWKGSTHEFEGVTCSSCHAVHAEHDPVLARETEAETCFTCHKNLRAEIMRPSAHPIREGEVACSDCHNPHGSSGPKLLANATVNQTCYSCHAEKRGPFLWEHAPVREDCTNCHKPHGSVHASMLKTRAPFLCQQCHMAPFHVSSVYSGTGLPGATTPSGAQQLLGKNCMNCHSQVHGSNHPSGVRITR